jgi:MerR family copper efflux transcriptional regulator
MVMARDGLLIGEIAKRSGVSRKALRLYEARGIVSAPRRTPSGYRQYPADILNVLAFITRGRSVGLSFGEISRIIALRCAGPGPCVEVRALLEQKVRDAQLVLRQLRRMLATWDAASRRRGVVCAHIERRGGETLWRNGRSVQGAKVALRSSLRATPSASARLRSTRQRGTG